MTRWDELAPPPPELPEGKRWHVFLSYRSVNRPWVVNLYDVLKHRGFKVFLDQVVLIPGTKLYSDLSRNLGLSAAGILVRSDASADSEWVDMELTTMGERALSGDFRFIVIRVDGAELPAFEGARLHLDFTEYPDGPNGGELLRLLYALAGQPLSEEANRFAIEQTEAARAANVAINAAIRLGDRERLVELFEAGGLAWESSAALGARVAEGLIRLGARGDNTPIEILMRLRAMYPASIRPQQLLALALSRRNAPGDRRDARRIMAELYEGGQRDPETVGIFARTLMDRYEETDDLADLRQSRDLYAEAFQSAADDYYVGINAAAKSVLLHELEVGAAHAAGVEAIVGVDPVPGDYWQSATVAEVQLLQQHWEAAARRYADAVAVAPAEHGSHDSTRLQARRLMAVLDPTPEQRAAIEQAFDHTGCR